MSNAAAAYAKTAQATLPPRHLEAQLLMKAASRLQAIRDNWDESRDELSPALLYNRKLWTIFVGSVTDETSVLPPAIRQNIANLGLFVFKRTLEVEMSPSAEKLAALVEINRNVATGLRGAA